MQTFDDKSGGCREHRFVAGVWCAFVFTLMMTCGEIMPFTMTASLWTCSRQAIIIKVTGVSGAGDFG